MLRQKFKLLNPFGPRHMETFRSFLGDVVELVGEKWVSNEEEFIHDMKSHDPDLLLAGVGIPHVTKKVIRSGKKLKAVVCTTMGVDFVDLDAATEKGVFVTNTPDFASVAVAEFSIGLMFAFNRKIVSAHLAAISGNWNRREEFEGNEFQEKTIGIVGIGRIGRSLASRAKGLGMNIVAYDPYATADVARELRITLVDDLETLLKNSDIISIHVPLTDSTRKMIGETQLKMMKKSALIINCARGLVIDEKALTKALKEKWIAGAALDVLEEEPPNMDNPLLGLDNVIITPHIAWNTKEAKEKSQKTVKEEIVRIINGEIPKNLVNIEVLQRLDLTLKK